jgi:hypothetical protein
MRAFLSSFGSKYLPVEASPMLQGQRPFEHSATQNPTSAIQTQYRRYADVQKSPKLALLERRAFPLPAAGPAPREMQDIGG